MMKKTIKSLLILLLSLILIVLGYFAYLLIAYHRIDDNLSLDISNSGNPTDKINVGQTYRVSSANVGFGAYSDDFSFFMDGGTESWAFSKEAVNNNITNEAKLCQSLQPDFYLFQEVDIDSTRSYHVDEAALLTQVISENTKDTSCTFAVNYDSPFLMYPLTQPHGKSKSGLLTVSSVTINDSVRRQLPIETGFSKFLDLDRCYAKNYIDVDNGKQLVLFNVHLSAYTTDPSTAVNQIKMLTEDMQAEYDAGNYVIVGGDMNKDLLGDSSEYFGGDKESHPWAKTFPTELLPDSFEIVGPIDENNPAPSCRNADAPYTENTFVLTVDGFIISSNVELVDANVLNAEFKYSDHNPVYMDFILK